MLPGLPAPRCCCLDLKECCKGTCIGAAAARPPLEPGSSRPRVVQLDPGLGIKCVPAAAGLYCEGCLCPIFSISLARIHLMQTK